MSFLRMIEGLPFLVWVRESSSLWAFPTFLVLHTIGMAIVAGCTVMTSLAILGFWPKISIRPLERLYPLMWFGFTINAVTGFVLLAADATTRLMNWDFYVKMIFVFLGVWLLHRTRRQVFGDLRLDQGIVPKGARLLACASLVCWLGAIAAGRLLAYVGGTPGGR